MAVLKKNTSGNQNKYSMVQWRNWLAYLPVTEGVAGSSPVWTAIYADVVQW